LTVRDRVIINRLPTGVSGLDEVLGGGLPEYSFNLIAGAPGTGKTTLSQQLMFALGTPERPALHFTVVGEPSLKLLRYQQQFSFFDPARVGTSVRYVNLSHETLEQGLNTVLDAIVAEVTRVSPGVAVVDSFLTVVPAAAAARDGGLELQGFLERLALHLTTRQATTFLVGEYEESDAPRNPVLAVADGILWLYQSIDRNSSKRPRPGHVGLQRLSEHTIDHTSVACGFRGSGRGNETEIQQVDLRPSPVKLWSMTASARCESQTRSRETRAR
jgi:circadian clock protein KaiC